MIHKSKYLYYILRSSEEEIFDIIGDIDSYYYHFRKPKKKYGDNQEENGKTRYRDLYPSVYNLKRLQERLNFFLQQKIKLPEYAYGSIKGRSNILNALAHIHNEYFLSIGLKNFFPYITHHQVNKMFMSFDFSPTVSHILTKLTTFKGGLPQGAPTSPIIANMVFVQTGLKLQALSSQYKLTFTSYLDDLEFSSKNDFKFLIPEILREIKQAGFYINHKKISYKQKLPEITGLFINCDDQLILNSIINKRAKSNQFTVQYVKRVRAASKGTKKF